MTAVAGLCIVGKIRATGPMPTLCSDLSCLWSYDSQKFALNGEPQLCCYHYCSCGVSSAYINPNPNPDSLLTSRMTRWHF
ncbi:hypothetical protein BDR06DRAFT_625019 [Suillus hirtellus]|nr:hypothetical protein BDR06DRAFT_625019 [Suillus hirtellus]